MKYFIGRTRNLRSDIQAVIAKIDFEVSKDKAKELYMIWGKQEGWEGDALEQLPLAFWKQGKCCALNNYDIWGEDISDSELFKRRLKGTLSPIVQ